MSDEKTEYSGANGTTADKDHLSGLIAKRADPGWRQEKSKKNRRNSGGRSTFA